MTKKESKPRRRRRKKPASSPAEGNAVFQDDADQGSVSFSDYAIFGGAFGTVGALLVASDMYDAVGVLGSLFFFPFAVVFFGIMGFVAVYLRAIVSAVLVPALMLLFIGAIAHTIIWGSSDLDSEPSTPTEISGVHSGE